MSFNKEAISDLTGDYDPVFEVRLWVVMVYVLLAYVTVFLVYHSSETSRSSLAWQGLLLALVVYTVFNVTLMIMVGSDRWSLQLQRMAVLDVLWGVFSVGVVVQVAFSI